MENVRKKNPSSPDIESNAFLAEEDRWDLFTPISLLVLCTMSVLFIHSAQAYVGGNQWKMQIIWCVIGFSSILRFQSWIIIFG